MGNEATSDNVADRFVKFCDAIGLGEGWTSPGHVR
jgi:hypothetical protein